MITSPHNDKLKEIRRLQRHAEERFVAEGEDLVAAAERAGWPAVYRLEAGVDVEPALLDDVSALGSGTRVIGVYERRPAAPTGPLCVALWGVRDPGNVGTVVRSALAFGAASVALGPDCADPYGPKAVRASMGAIFALPVARVDDPSALPGRVVGLAARTGAPLSGPLDGDTTILVGAERTGLPDAVLAACDEVAHIPIAGDSLNAAMAATVALYEATRGQTPGTATVPDDRRRGSPRGRRRPRRRAHDRGRPRDGGGHARRGGRDAARARRVAARTRRIGPRGRGGPER